MTHRSPPRDSVAIAGCLLGGALVAFRRGRRPTTGRAVDQINGMSTRPLPSVAPNPVAPPAKHVWVPDRTCALPGEPTPVRVPGHWEHRLPGGNLSVPPVTVERPSDGTYRDAARPPRAIPVEERVNSRSRS